MKIKKFEKELLEFICDNYLVLGFIFVTILAITMRVFMFSFESNDYTVFLSKWYAYLKENGGIMALATYQGNYNAPYMTLMALFTYLPIKSLYAIKIISVLFDFGLALSAAALVKYLVPKNKDFYFFLTYSIILFIPEIALNGALWGQCDAGYTMFVILALLYLLKDNYFKSFIFLGIAFALKLQFIFILPLFIVIYFVKQKFPIWHFLIIPIVNFILCLPAIIVGKPIGELLVVYFKQAGEYRNSINLNFLNLYGLIAHAGERAAILHYPGVLATMFACLMMLVYIIYKKVKLTDKKILNLGLWFIVITTFLLPSMHERYLYMGCALSAIYFITYKENFVIMLGIFIGSILTYFAYLFGLATAIKDIAIIVYTVVIAYYTKDLVRMLDDQA